MSAKSERKRKRKEELQRRAAELEAEFELAHAHMVATFGTLGAHHEYRKREWECMGPLQRRFNRRWAMMYGIIDAALEE